MAETFPFKLVTPIGIAFEDEVESVTAMNPLGEFGVLAEHINYITSLVPCVLTVKLPGSQYRFFVVPDGLAEVKDGIMTVLASEAIAAELVERDDAAGEVAAAEERIGHMSFYEVEYEGAERKLQLARARVRAAELKAPHHY
ncbi:MAG TPA: ATP synthase F1 subunit epsilon [Candidatus Binataceae bacterium]|nr:ATP synthase F1 subunit epsilon [Candidatus Binataceae bacterium]